MENENKETPSIDFDSIRSLASEDKTIQAKLLDIVKGTETGKAYSETIAKNYFEGVSLFSFSIRLYMI